MNNRDYPNSGILFRNDRKCGDRALLKGTADITCPHGNQRANLRVIRGRKEGVALPRPSHQIASGKIRYRTSQSVEVDHDLSL